MPLKYLLRSWFLQVVGVLLLCLLCRPLSAEWIHGRTENFEIYSAMRKSSTASLMKELELFRYWAVAPFKKKTASASRCLVLLLDDEDEMQSFRPSPPDKNGRSVGMFFPDPESPAILICAIGLEDRGQSVIFHEYTHSLLRALMPNPPLWFNEGLAQCYETAVFDGNKVSVGKPVNALLDTLLRRQFIPLRHLFSIGERSSEYTGGADQSVFYAQSWLFTHLCLYGQPKLYEEKLLSFVDMIARGEAPNEDTFRKAFGMGFDEMQRNLRAYLEHGRYTKLTVTLPELKEAEIHLLPMNDADRKTLMDCVRTRRLPRKDIPEEYRKLEHHLKYDFQSENAFAVTYASLVAKACFGDEVADRLEKRAVELGTDNAAIYSSQLRKTIDQIGFSPFYRMPADLCERLRVMADKGLSLSPANESLITYLAFVEAFSPEPRVAAVNQLQRVINKMRNRNSALLSVAVLRWRVGDLETSKSIVDLLAQQELGNLRHSVEQMREVIANAARKGTSQPAQLSVPYAQ